MRTAAYVLGSGHKGRLRHFRERLPGDPALGWYEETRFGTSIPVSTFELALDRPVRAVVWRANAPSAPSNRSARTRLSSRCLRASAAALPRGPGRSHRGHEAGGGSRDRDRSSIPRAARGFAARHLSAMPPQGDFRPRRAERRIISPGRPITRPPRCFSTSQNRMISKAVGRGPRLDGRACYRKAAARRLARLCHDPHRDVSTTPRETYNRRCNECHERQFCSRPGEE